MKEDTGFFGQTTNVNIYNVLHTIGEGTYGTVFKGERKDNGAVVAIKKIKLRSETAKDGMPMTALREVLLLKKMDHENIIKLHDVAVGGSYDSMSLVFEYCENDLADLMDHAKVRFKESEAKCLVRQILDGVRVLHANFIVHRDLKPSNLLYTNTGCVKICDLGLARVCGDPPRVYSPKVLTLWYRAPEILLGEMRYTNAIDMWSCGCIAAELLLGAPLMPGKTDTDQLQYIYDVLGTPSEADTAAAMSLPNFKLLLSMQSRPVGTLKRLLPSQSSLSFIASLLAFIPPKRLKIEQALRHPYFEEMPYATNRTLMPRFPPCHRKQGTEGTQGKRKRNE